MWIDTAEEWALSLLMLLVIIVISLIGIIFCTGKIIQFLYLTIIHWDLDYFREKI